MSIDTAYEQALDLLQALIAIPSYSREENATADLLVNWFAARGITCSRKGNNVWAQYIFSPGQETLLLCSHHDTVRPAAGYTKHPFSPFIEEGRLYGLGSNDAGASLVAMAATFLYLVQRGAARYNLVFAAVAEEETSGNGGISLLLPELPQLHCALVGEPTMMQMAVAERGLLVLDCTSCGVAGHAARNEGESALYKAVVAIQQLQELHFEKVSELLGAVSLNVTGIQTENKAHNVVPDRCTFMVDVRVNELYTHEAVLDRIRQTIDAEVQPRSLRLRSSMIPLKHELVQKGLSMGMGYYGSPTLSDKALMPFPALKLGPGDSARSHTADEFVYLQEIRQGIEGYIELIKR